MDAEAIRRKRVQEGKLDDMDLKIAIVKHKQEQAMREIEDAEKATKLENRQYAIMAEELERKLVQVEKKKADRLLTHNAYVKGIKRIRQDISQSEAQSLATAQQAELTPGEDKENWRFSTRLGSE